MKKLTFALILNLISITCTAQNAKLWGIPLNYSYDQFKSSINNKFGHIEDNGSTFNIRADFAGFTNCPIEIVKAKNGYLLLVKITLENVTINDFTSLVVSYMDKYVSNKKICEDEYVIYDNKLNIYIKYMISNIEIRYVLDNNTTKIYSNDF